MTTAEHAGGVEHLKQPVRLVAAHDIALAEREASSARALYDGDEFAGLSHQERVRYRAIHQAFYELVEIQGAVQEEADIVLELFAENPEIANATLTRVEMQGAWDAADPFERELLGLLFDTGYKGSLHRIPREHPDAKVGVLIPAGFTKEDGFVALRRTRRLIIAEHIDGADALRPRIEVDKISTFALDINHLASLSDVAVAEVRLIVAMTMYNAIDWSALRFRHMDTTQMAEGDYEEIMLADAKRQLRHGDDEPIAKATVTAFNDAMKLARAMNNYGMTVEELRHRLHNVSNPSQLHDPTSKAFIEGALTERSDLLTPAATTYYVHS